MFVYQLSGLSLKDEAQAPVEIEENETTARSAVYQVLGRLFLDADDEHFEKAREGLWVKELQEASALLPFELTLPEGGRVPPELAKADHVGEFRRLFGEGGEVPPFGSAYQSDGDFRDEVRRQYEYYGLAADATRRVDHLATECDYMQYLTFKEAASSSDRLRGSYRRAQHDFVARHFGEWVPAFAARVEGAGASRFFSWAAGILASFVASDADYVRGLVEG